ncbi:MAG: hypothetical protein AAFO73_05445 [Pseudomonadota bacterium]
MSPTASLDSLEEREQKARISKLQEEAAYIRAQRTLYPVVVFSGATLAAVGIIKVFLS